MGALKGIKFSIRDLLLWTLLGALCAGWWVDHRRMNSKLADYPIRISQKKFELMKIDLQLKLHPNDFKFL
jgi:hypothetical protein